MSEISTVNDMGVIEKARQFQCPEAFSTLMDENIDMVRRVIYRIILNEHDTDDLTQETFVAAFRNIGSFKGKAKFSTWLCRIAYNKAYLFLRKKEKGTISDGIIKQMAGSKKLHADAEIKSAETNQEIMEALKELPDNQRAVITLTAMEGKSVKEAAYILNCSVMSLYWQLQQTRKKLSKKLLHLMN